MKSLNQFAKKRFKRLLALLKAFPAGKEKEELHMIRLEIKKLKALLRFIHFNDKEFRDHKSFIPFRTIFRETGTIRDGGLRNELLEQHTQLHTAFYRSPDKAHKQFKINIPGHIKVVKKQKKSILKKIADIKSRTYTHYLRKKTGELTTILGGGVRQKDLHGLRKLIKEITYLTMVTTKKNKVDPFLIESAALIGDWHDKRVLIPWIRIHAPNEKETLTRLQVECNSDLQNLRELIEKWLNVKKVKSERGDRVKSKQSYTLVDN